MRYKMKYSRRDQRILSQGGRTDSQCVQISTFCQKLITTSVITVETNFWAYMTAISMTDLTVIFFRFFIYIMTSKNKQKKS